jgi:hypothetical protein
MSDSQQLDLDGEKVQASNIVICPVTGEALLAPGKASAYSGSLIAKVVRVTPPSRDHNLSTEVFVHPDVTIRLIG